MDIPMQCPICKARNDAGPQCRRCRADLSPLFELEKCRSRLLADAYLAMRSGRWDQARAAALGEQARDHCVQSRAEVIQIRAYGCQAHFE